MWFGSNPVKLRARALAKFTNGPLLHSVRALLGLTLFIWSLFLSFDGFPGALLSWLGGGIVLIGYTGSIATLTHNDQGMTGVQRFIAICIGFALASLGAAIVVWGGLVSVTIADFLTIDFSTAGIVLGIVGGLFNIDKTFISTPGAGNRTQSSLLPTLESVVMDESTAVHFRGRDSSGVARLNQ